MPDPDTVERWTLYQCPICRDRPQLGPVSREGWSCSNGHPTQEAVPIEVVPAAGLDDCVRLTDSQREWILYQTEGTGSPYAEELRRKLSPTERSNDE